jgi:hypothetical protein
VRSKVNGRPQVRSLIYIRQLDCDVAIEIPDLAAIPLRIMRFEDQEFEVCKGIRNSSTSRVARDLNNEPANNAGQALQMNSSRRT